jgi:hypothetical protein
MSKEKNSCINEFLNEVQRIEIIGQINLSVKTGNQYNVEYVELLKELQQSALTELLSLEGKQINLHVKRFEHIKKRFIEFWSYYRNLCEKYRSDSIDVFEFKKKISSYFIVSNFTATKITEEFLFDLQDALMLKDGSLRGLIDQYRELNNPKPSKSKEPHKNVIALFCQFINYSEVMIQGYSEINEKYCKRVCKKYNLEFKDSVRQNYHKTVPSVVGNNDKIQEMRALIYPLLTNDIQIKIDNYINSITKKVR